MNWALLVGSVPRKAGMERKDLLGINGKIFTWQGQAIAANAASDVRVLVVGNPCNTNCLIAMNNARDVPQNRWFAMTRLDENRAKSQLALKSGAHWRDVTRSPSGEIIPAPSIRISTTRASTAGPPPKRSPTARGSRVTSSSSFSSAARPSSSPRLLLRQSAANAVVDTVRSLIEPTPAGDWHSVAVCADGSYGVDQGLISSFPVRSAGRKIEIVPDLPLNAFSRAKIEASVAELKEERTLVHELIPS